MPERCVLLFGQEGPGLSEEARARRTPWWRSRSSARPGRSTRERPPPSSCTSGSAAGRGRRQLRCGRPVGWPHFWPSGGPLEGGKRQLTGMAGGPAAGDRQRIGSRLARSTSRRARYSTSSMSPFAKRSPSVVSALLPCHRRRPSTGDAGGRTREEHGEQQDPEQGDEEEEREEPEPGPVDEGGGCGGGEHEHSLCGRPMRPDRTVTPTIRRSGCRGVGRADAPRLLRTAYAFGRMYAGEPVHPSRRRTWGSATPRASPDGRGRSRRRRRRAAPGRGRRASSASATRGS